MRHSGGVRSPSPVFRDAWSTSVDMSLDGRIHAIASRQDGVFAAAQAVAAGATYAHLARRVEAGVYRRLVRGGYLVGGVPVTWRRKVRAVCLVTDGVAAGRTAAALWGLDPFREGPIDLVVPRGRPTVLVRARRTALRRDDIRSVDGIPVTSPELTLCDLAALVPRAKLEAAVDGALRLRLTSAERLGAEAEVLLRPGRKGAALMRDVLVDLGPRPVGKPARELCRLLEAAGLPPPELEYPVRRPDGRMAYLDGAYPDEGVAVEIDDYTSHANPRAADDDHERQNELGEVLVDWRWVRVTPRQIRRRPQWVVSKMANALGRDPGDHRLPPGRRPRGR